MKTTPRILLLVACLSASQLFGAPDQPAKPSKTPAPATPLRHLEKKVAGYAIAEFTVASAGAVKDLRIVEGTDKDFEMAVLTTVSRWRFKAASKEGKAVETRMRYRFTFPAGEEKSSVQEEAFPTGAADRKPTGS